MVSKEILDLVQAEEKPKQVADKVDGRKLRPVRKPHEIYYCEICHETKAANAFPVNEVICRKCAEYVRKFGKDL